MKNRAFTLIELLVVIAIIAILAAILFPVFAQAKLAAKKTQGLAQAKQIGTSTQIYIADFDDTFFPYRYNGTNPDWAKLNAAGNPDANLIGTNTRTRIFFKHMLDPYVKNDSIWQSPGNADAWVTVDRKQDSDNPAVFGSYGAQNSYGVNSYGFTPDGNGLNSTTIAEVSNTILLIDAMYYNVLPRYAAQLNGNLTGTAFVCTSSYPTYWKSLGNSFRFGAAGEPTDAQALKRIDSRFNGTLNVVRFDTSSKALKSNQVLNDLQNNPTSSMWDPYKAGTTACP